MRDGRLEVVEKKINFTTWWVDGKIDSYSRCVSIMAGKRQEGVLFIHTNKLNAMFSTQSKCVSLCFSSPSISIACLDLCSQRRTYVSGRPVRTSDMEKMLGLQRKWKTFTSKFTGEQLRRNTLFYILLTSTSDACDSGLFWPRELCAGSTSTARQWIKRWRESNNRITLSWTMHRCTSIS